MSIVQGHNAGLIHCEKELPPPNPERLAHVNSPHCFIQGISEATKASRCRAWRRRRSLPLAAAPRTRAAGGTGWAGSPPGAPPTKPTTVGRARSANVFALLDGVTDYIENSCLTCARPMAHTTGIQADG